MSGNDKLIVEMEFGSYLYGTNTEFSDRDYKGIYLPSFSNCVIGNVKHSITNNTKKNSNQKNNSEDVDYEIYSIQYFILSMGRKGDTTFLDMLHAPDNKLIKSSPEWEFIRKNRSKFYTKTLHSYIGYCRTQAAKYGIKGSKLEVAETVLGILNNHNESDRLEVVYDRLPETDYTKKVELNNGTGNTELAYDFCGKLFGIKTKIKLVKEGVSNFVKKYGERAALAKNNSGIDWKAISHAFRAGLQLTELLTTGNIVYPLKDADFLVKLKVGNFHYVDDGIGERLSDLVNSVEVIAKNSSYPEEIDITFWENWLVSLYK